MSKDDSVINSTINTAKRYGKALEDGFDEPSKAEDVPGTMVKKVADQLKKDYIAGAKEVAHQVRDWNNVSNAEKQQELQDRTVNIHKELHQQGNPVPPDVAREIASSQLQQEQQNYQNSLNSTIWDTPQQGTSMPPTPTAGSPQAPMSSFADDVSTDDSMAIIDDSQDDFGNINDEPMGISSEHYEEIRDDLDLFGEDEPIDTLTYEKIGYDEDEV